MIEQITLGEYRITTIGIDENWGENCYQVVHTPSKEQLLIDPGDNESLILERVLDSGAALRHILLTHAHYDHVGAAAPLCRRFNLACQLHYDDIRLLRHAPMYAFRFAQKEISLPESYQAFADGTILSLGQQSIEVIHTPGHTAGSVCYRLGDVVFTGDTLLFKRVGRTDLPGGDIERLKDSIGRLLNSLPDQVIMLPGHGRSWTAIEARSWWSNRADLLPQFTGSEIP